MSNVDTRPILMLPEQPVVAVLQSLPPPFEAPSNLPPLVAALQNLPPPIEAPSNLPPPIEAHWSMPSRVGGSPKWPPAPRTLGDRLALPAILFVLALGVGALLLLW